MPVAQRRTSQPLRSSPIRRSSPRSNAISPNGGQTKQKPTPKPPQLPKPLVSLETFLSNFVAGALINSDDEVFEITFDKVVSKDVQDNGNSMPLNFNTFKALIAENRRNIADRRLLSESFLTQAADAEGVTGTVAHTFEFRGVQAKEEVLVKVVAVVSVGLDGTGERKLVMEKFVLVVEEV